MTVQLDHAIVPSRDRRASAELLASILAAPWERETKAGPFSPVYVNDGLTFDFADAQPPFPLLHFCFRVGEAEFDAIVGRLNARRIAYRSKPFGPDDRQVDTHHGGRGVYWNEPDGHVWEALTVSYARRAAKPA